MLIAIASGRMISQCASTTGNATRKYTVSTSSHSNSFSLLSKVVWGHVRTYPHNNQKAGHKSPQLHNAIPTPTVHEVILTTSFATYPVRERGDAVGGNYEESKVVLEEGAAEDDEEEADGEDLLVCCISSCIMRMVRGGVRRRGL